MSSRHAIFLTGRRELRERLRSRAFRVSTGVQVLLVVGAVVLSGVLGGDDTTTFDVGVVGPQARAVGKAAQTRQRSIDATVKVRRLPSVAAARRAVADGDVDAALSGRSVVASADPEDALIGLLQGASASVRGSAILDRSGVPPGRARAALAPPALAVDSVAGEDQGKGLAFAATLLLYIAILTFGYTVSSGVVEEKSSRVVEIVVSAIRPLDLLAGKVFGIGILGLGQVLAIAAAGLGTALAIGKVDLPSSTATTAAVVVVFWLLGYAFYACAYAAAGCSSPARRTRRPPPRRCSDSRSPATSRPSPSSTSPTGRSRWCAR